MKGDDFTRRKIHDCSLRFEGGNYGWKPRILQLANSHHHYENLARVDPRVLLFD